MSATYVGSHLGTHICVHMSHRARIYAYTSHIGTYSSMGTHVRTHLPVLTSLLCPCHISPMSLSHSPMSLCAPHAYPSMRVCLSVCVCTRAHVHTHTHKHTNTRTPTVLIPTCTLAEQGHQHRRWQGSGFRVQGSGFRVYLSKDISNGVGKAGDAVVPCAAFGVGGLGF